MKTTQKKDQAKLIDVLQTEIHAEENQSQLVGAREEERKKNIPDLQVQSDEFAYLDSEVFGDLVGDAKNQILDVFVAKTNLPVQVKDHLKSNLKTKLKPDDDFFDVKPAELPFATLQRRLRDDFRYIAGMGQSQKDNIVFE